MLNKASQIEQSIVLVGMVVLGYGIYQIYEGAQVVTNGIKTVAEAVGKTAGEVADGMVKAGEYGTPQYYETAIIKKNDIVTVDPSKIPPAELVGTALQIGLNPAVMGEVVYNTSSQPGGLLVLSQAIQPIQLGRVNEGTLDPGTAILRAVGTFFAPSFVSHAGNKV